MSNSDRQHWIELYDPSQYLGSCQTRIFFVNGTNDFAYLPDIYEQSYPLIKGERNFQLTVKMELGHSLGWHQQELSFFWRKKPEGWSTAAKHREADRLSRPIKCPNLNCHRTQIGKPALFKRIKVRIPTVNGKPFWLRSLISTSPLVYPQLPPSSSLFTVEDDKECSCLQPISV